MPKSGAKASHFHATGSNAAWPKCWRLVCRSSSSRTNILRYLRAPRAVSSVGSEHLVYTEGVGGSSPSPPTPGTGTKAPAMQGLFVPTDRAMEMVSCTHQACLWAEKDSHFIRGHPSMLPGASRRTSPTTNKLPPTQTTSSFAPCARAPSSASNGEPMISPRNSDLTLATRFGAMARGMSAAHHQYVASSGSKAMTAEGSLSATAPQTMWSAPPRCPAFLCSSSTVAATRPSRLWAPSSTTSGTTGKLYALPTAKLTGQRSVVRQPV